MNIVARLVQWEKKAKAGMAPSKRASFAMVKQKNCAILFGGAADEEAKGGEVLVSSFFNDLYQLNLEQWRWYPVVMRVKQQEAGAAPPGVDLLSDWPCPITYS